MKFINFKKLPVSTGFLAILICFLITFQNCQKEAVVNPNPSNLESENSEFDQEEEKYESMIKTAAVGLFELAKDPIFRAKINDLVALQFDDDDNTLLKTVFEEMQNENVNLITEFQNSINLWKQTVEQIDQSGNAKYKDVTMFTSTEEIGQAVNGFDYHSEDTVYAQIYIPFADSVDLNDTPVIVLGMEDECTSDGYIITQSGTVSLITVDEDFAKNNLVWVVSGNEVVDNQGDIPEIEFEVPENSGNNHNVVRPRMEYDNTVKLTEILITTKKECWLCGKAEVSIIMPAIIYNTCEETKIAQLRPIKKVSRKQVGDTIKLSNKIIFPSFEFQSGGVEHTPLRVYEDTGWIYFEKDKRKKYQRNDNIPPCSMTYNYRSKQTPYGIEGFFALGPRDIWQWHRQGMFTYPGDVNTPAGSGVTFEMKRVD